MYLGFGEDMVTTGKRSQGEVVWEWLKIDGGVRVEKGGKS